MALHIHTAVHTFVCIQFYFALYNSRQQQQQHWQQIFNVHAINWIEKPLALGVVAMASWFLFLSLSFTIAYGNCLFSIVIKMGAHPSSYNNNSTVIIFTQMIKYI